MAKINPDNYTFIDLTKTDYTQFTAAELDRYAADTTAVLSATGKKLKKTPMNVGLTAGLLAIRGGEFIKVMPIAAKYKKGNANKNELKVIKRAMNTARLYYLFKNILAMVMKKENDPDLLNPHIAVKK